MPEINDKDKREEIYPVGIQIEIPFQLPFEYGQYPIEIEKRPCIVIFGEPDKPKEPEPDKPKEPEPDKPKEPEPDKPKKAKSSQEVIVLFPGVSFDEKKGPSVEDEERVKEFFNSVVNKKQIFRTGYFPPKTVSYKADISGETWETRGIPFKEEAAVYEIGAEAINKIVLATKCAVVGLFHLPLVDEDYLSGRGYIRALFMNYIPRADKKIAYYPAIFAMALMKREVPQVTREEYENVIRKILANRKDYVIDEMLVSANTSFHSGEYEAGIILLETVFEALIKESIKEYYEGFPGEYVQDVEAYKDDVEKLLSDKAIRDLLRDEYPKCENSQWFRKGVPQYEIWDELYKKRNSMIHHISKRGRLTKEEALQMFDDFDEVFMYLFGRHSSLKWGRE